MKLDIINHNPNIVKDKESINNLKYLINEIDDNLSTYKYIEYQNLLEKINKFINMLTPIFQKNLKEIESKKNYFDEENNDDNISIGSISEYDIDYDYDDEKLENEEYQINNFEQDIKKKFKEIFNRFNMNYEIENNDDSYSDTDYESENENEYESESDILK
jgi:hypothetical protein